MHSRNHWFIASAAVLAVLITAQSAGAVERDELDERLASLQQENARLKKRLQIENLEKENAALRKQLSKSRADEPAPPRPRATSRLRSHSSLRTLDVATPATAYAMASATPVVAPLPSWAGFYAGASFGIGQLRAEETDNGTSVSNSTSSSSSRFDSASFPSTSESTNQSGSQGTSFANMKGAKLGGIANFSLGFTSMWLGSNFVGGAQVEGGVSRVKAQLTGAGTSLSNSSFTSTSTFTSRCLPCIPPTTTTSTGTFSSTSNSMAAQSMSGALDSQWFVSALARGGYLIDPYNLVYILGGWTYSGFEIPQNDVQFGLHGGTIGAGFERRISPLWGMKVEYRYTKFQSKTIDLQSSTASTLTSTQPATATSGSSSSTTTNTSFSNTAAHFNADMQTVLVGVSRYFGTY